MTTFRIFYVHKDCKVDPGVEWQDTWSSAVNGECPACNTTDIEPVDWEEIGADDEDESVCDHEWNQTAGEADESGTRIYCLLCGQDGDA